MITGDRKKSTLEREAYFLSYIEKARKLTKNAFALNRRISFGLLLWTKALEEGNLDVVGLARPFCLYPNLANQIFDGSVKRFEAPIPSIGIKFLDQLGGVELPWYELQIQTPWKRKIPPKKTCRASWPFWFSLKSLFFKSFLEELKKKAYLCNYF